MGQNQKLSPNQIAGFLKMQSQKKEVNDEVYFGMQLNMKVIYKLLL